MNLTKEELGMLKLLIVKELERLEEEGKKLLLSNSPFLNQIKLDEDVEFLKNVAMYKLILENLKKKL